MYVNFNKAVNSLYHHSVNKVKVNTMYHVYKHHDFPCSRHLSDVSRHLSNRLAPVNMTSHDCRRQIGIAVTINHCFSLHFAFSALTLLVGWQEGHQAWKKWRDGGYSGWSGARPDGQCVCLS